MEIFRRQEDRTPGGSTPEDATRHSGVTRSDGPALLAFAAARVKAVVDAAGLAAAEIRSQADSQRPVDGGSTLINRERLVFELAIALAERADQLSRDAAALEGLLERARDRLETVADPSRPLGRHPRETADPAVGGGPRSGHHEVVSTQEPARIELKSPAVAGAGRFKSKLTDDDDGDGDDGDGDGDGSNAPGARSIESTEALDLLATQMAIAGSDREEIERRLRDEHGVEDPGSILARVLGPRA